MASHYCKRIVLGRDRARPSRISCVFAMFPELRDRILYLFAWQSPETNVYSSKFSHHYFRPPSFLTNSCKGKPHPNPAAFIRALSSRSFFVQLAFFWR